MTLDWKRLAARIDEMTLRQRALLFAAASLLVVTLAHAVLIDPVLAKHKGLIDRVNRDQSQMSAVRSQIEKIFSESEAELRQPEQAAIRELERRIAEAEQSLAAKKQTFIAAERLPTLLKDLLGGNRQVRLESLRLVPGTPVVASSGAAGSELYRHGVELTLRGGYFDLVQYLAELEQLPARLLWGPVALQVEQYPELKLTLQVHALSPQRSLLTL